MPNKEYLDKDKFVEVWLEAMQKQESQTWIATQLNTSRQGVSAMAFRLRNRGVDLPKLQTGNPQPKSEVDLLNDKIKKVLTGK